MNAPIRNLLVGISILALAVALRAADPPLSPEQQRKIDELGDATLESIKLAGREQLPQAIAVLEHALAVRTEVYGRTHGTRVNTLEHLAERCEENEDFDKAAHALKELIDVRRTVHGPDHYKVVDARWDLRRVERKAQLGAADRQRLKDAGKQSRDVVEAIDRGEPDKAIRLSTEVLALRRQLLGGDFPETSSALTNLGGSYQAKGDYTNARRYMDEALALREKSLGLDHPETATALSNIGSLLHHQGEYAAAKPLLERALDIRTRAYGKNHIEVIRSYRHLGALLNNQGDYAAAIPYFEQALAISEKLFDKYDPAIPAALNNLGMLRKSRGDYPGARACFERALAMRRLVNKEFSEPIAESYNSLGLLLRDQGDYAQAREYLEKALDIRWEINGKNHADTATAFTNLGLIYLAEDNPTEARKQFEDARDIRLAVLGRNHLDTANSFECLAGVCSDEGRFDKAREYFEDVLTIRRRILGGRHRSVAVTHGNLGGLLRRQGQNEAALTHFDKALAIYRQALGDGHPDTAQALYNLGCHRLRMGQDAIARKDLEEVLMRRLALAHDLLGTLTEAEALAYVRTTESGRDPLLSALRRLPGVSPAEAYKVVWDTRALASRAIASRRRPGNTDPKAQELSAQLRSKRAQLAQLTLSAVPVEQRAARSARLRLLATEKEELERQLAAGSADFRKDQATQRADYTDLLARLPREAAVLDMVRVTVTERGQDGAMTFAPHYEAFILRGGDAPSVHWVHLGPAAPIEKAARDWRKAIVERQPSGNGEAPETTLRRLVWAPVEDSLGDATAVLLVPDAALTSVPWSALPGKRPGSFLLEDYTLATASHGQQLLEALQRRPPTGNRFLMVGGVNYNAAQASVPTGSVAHMRGPALAAESRPTWGFLAGTEHETHAITQLWPQPEHMTVLRGTEACKARVRDQLPGARYIHLATHGFFADSRFRSSFDHDVRGEQLAFGSTTVTGRNPLILSGVVLAGANRPAKLNDDGTPQGDDGILTAEEVAELDLSAAELVVLSACETGLGELAGGEGVFGLQRAFALAGARTTVASLWKVSDDATQQLMTRFYENLLRRHMGPAEALRQAQISLLRRSADATMTRGVDVVSASEASAHPSLWAAWTLSGAPGDLTRMTVEPQNAPVPESTEAPGPRWDWLIVGGALGVALAGVLFWQRRKSEPGT
ncbi:MAG: tetratricopeptide repeat protein [Gemmataceae bacterium]|nr:tetratricopeptide repeat protein [Gemmataceae bacterium]